MVIRDKSKKKKVTEIKAFDNFIQELRRLYLMIDVKPLGGLKYSEIRRLLSKAITLADLIEEKHDIIRKELNNG